MEPIWPLYLGRDDQDRLPGEPCKPVFSGTLLRLDNVARKMSFHAIRIGRSAAAMAAGNLAQAGVKTFWQRRDGSGGPLMAKALSWK